jgi:hypothetical protein
MRERRIWFEFDRFLLELAQGLNERVQVDAFLGALEYWHDILTDLAGD